MYLLFSKIAGLVQVYHAFLGWQRVSHRWYDELNCNLIAVEKLIYLLTCNDKRNVTD
jgi:hypothetical protein